MKNRIRKPVTGGVARVPLVMQMEALECGAASLAMVMAYYGRWVPLEQLRIDCGVSRNGSKAENIYHAAEKYGFSVNARGRKAEVLREKGTFPCIVFWNMNHFVVLNGFRGKKVYINDPDRGFVRLPWEEFCQCYSGIVITPVPGEDFVPGGKPKSMLSFVRSRMKGAGTALVFAMLTTSLLYLFGIVNSVTSRIFLDRILTQQNPDWLYPYTALMVILALMQIVLSLTESITKLKLDGKMSMAGSVSFMWKIMRMPMSFFEQRLAGDIQGRIASNAGISGSLVSTFAPLFLNSFMMIIYLVLMLRQSLLLSAVGITVLAFNALVSNILSKKRINYTRLKIRDENKLASLTSSGIHMIETIKASGAEDGFFRKWSGYQAGVNTQTVLGARVEFWFNVVLRAVNHLSGDAILVLGLFLIMEGKMTLGGIMMFQGFLSSFMSPALSFVSAGQMIQELRTDMERVEDVLRYPEDENVQENEEAPHEVSKLQGELEIRGLTFGYSRLDPPVLKDFSLRMKPGAKVALVGSSGCGKSTVAKLVSGLYQPWEGEILYDGKPRSAWPRDVLTGSIAVVDQDVTIFADTISANIRMWDESILDFETILAARDAQIHDDIMRISGGYRARLTSGGTNLSGGQRQRIEIARALALDPTVIILDEATSALDARTEYDVMKAIRNRGITCLVIAHRLSTIRDCDEIIVLDKGEIAERGTHQELMQKGGLYAGLIASE